MAGDDVALQLPHDLVAEALVEPLRLRIETTATSRNTLGVSRKMRSSAKAMKPAAEAKAPPPGRNADRLDVADERAVHDQDDEAHERAAEERARRTRAPGSVTMASAASASRRSVIHGSLAAILRAQASASLRLSSRRISRAPSLSAASPPVLPAPALN